MAPDAQLEFRFQLDVHRSGELCGGQVLRELFSDFLPMVCQKVDSWLKILFLKLQVFSTVSVVLDCSLISFVQLHVIAFRRDVICGLSVHCTMAQT
jgi:hypothetical protein